MTQAAALSADPFNLLLVAPSNMDVPLAPKLVCRKEDGAEMIPLVTLFDVLLQHNLKR